MTENNLIEDVSAGPKVGEKAPSFKLKNVDGKMVSLSDYADKKGLIVVFSCNHCPYVVKYEDRINELNKKYAPLGFPLVAINPNAPKVAEDSYEKMIERHREKGFTFPYLLDETQEVAKKYGAERTPHVYILERKGKDFFIRYIGAIDDNAGDPNAVTKRYAADAIDALLAGKEVPVKETKAIGCTIKWK
ncbi:MAG: thioredoxin family protein [Bacteroidia bacterium]|nr:thioredoxin family protein [Bacteroidia bacterium]MDW8157535.1 thioredoxin family protein [Bacteroidia bacterium]